MRNGGEVATPTGHRRGRRRWTRASRVIPAVVVILLIGGVGGGLLWTQSVYGPETGPLNRVYSNPNLTLKETSTAWIMTPTGPGRGRALLFFPGAKVDPRAYLWKLAPLTAQGITVVVAKPLLNLPILDSRKLGTFVEGTPGANRWYVGGHSLGGVKACQLSRDPLVAGLVLFASYCDEEQPTRLPVLLVSAEHDRILNGPKADRARANLPPATLTEKVIAGANHASFGDYGAQAGDGTATRPTTEVAAELTGYLLAFLR